MFSSLLEKHLAQGASADQGFQGAHFVQIISDNDTYTADELGKGDTGLDNEAPT